MHVTFESKAAYRQAKIEFLAAHHPLIRAIATHYRRDTSGLHPVSRVVVKTDRVPQDRYLFLVYLLDVKGIRNHLQFEPVFVALETRHALDRSMGEELLGQMVTRGSSMEEMPVLEEDRVRDLIDSANEVFHERFRDLVADLRRSNDALAASRLGSIEGSYRVKLGRYQERLRTGRERNLDPRYVRMAEGAILRLESELAGKRQKIEESRRLSESYELVAGGVVEVRGS